MATISRSGLKQLVRELLREVLLEALGTEAPFTEARTPRGRQQVPKQPVHGRPNRGPGFFDPRLDQRVAAVAGSNAALADVLAETAAKTLPQMEQADRQLGHNDVEAAGRPAHGIQQVEQINGTPESIFGDDAAAHWATLAFADVKKPT